MKLVKQFMLFILIVVSITSCVREHDGTTELDEQIDQLLKDRGLSKSDFILPDDFRDIPQSRDNILTEEKIALGRSIFWDPIFNLNTFSSSNTQTASCGSCHVVDGHAGVSQGFGEGGSATGVGGEARVVDPNFINNQDIMDYVMENNIVGGGVELIDAQPIRPPTNLHVAYKPNALWNGALGNPDTSLLLNNIRANLNDGVSFPDAFPHDLAEEFNGFGGAEMQALAGLRVHRYKFDSIIIANAGYKEAFDRVFVDNNTTRITEGSDFYNKYESRSDQVANGEFLDKGRILLNGSLDDDASDDVWVPIQYSRLAAALALSAYTRSVVANDAPFQAYLKGNPNAITEAQKSGFITFLEKSCINCHNGPALTDANFHVMGTRDLGEVDPNVRVRIGNPIGGFVPAEELDLGRFNVTGDQIDRGKFMTQTLYNLPSTNFFHGGEKISLSDAVDYMLNAEMNEGKGFVKDPLWTKQTVSSSERNNLIEFLDKALRDNNFDFKYRPGAVAGGVGKVLSCGVNTSGVNGTTIDIWSPNRDAASTTGQDMGSIPCN